MFKAKTPTHNSPEWLQELFTALRTGDTDLYPKIKNVIVARNFNAYQSKRLLYDFLDIYENDYFKKMGITQPSNLILHNLDGFDYLIDFASSGIFENIPEKINNLDGEDIEIYIYVIQNLCDNIPINIDVRGIFSGITNKSTLQDKLLCKMRLNAMIMGMDLGSIVSKPLQIDLSYYKFLIQAETNAKVSYNAGNEPKIVKWGKGICPQNTEPSASPSTTKFTFKITKFVGASSSVDRYIVSISSMIDSNLTLLPLPSYFVNNIDKAILVSPDGCIGFSRKETYNVKFFITNDQYTNSTFNANSSDNAYFHFKSSDLTKDPLNFRTPPVTSTLPHGFKPGTPEDPFPEVLWLISDNTGLYIENTARVETSVVDASITNDSATIEGVITNPNDKIKGAGFYYIQSDTKPMSNGSGNDVPASYTSSNNKFTHNILSLTSDKNYYVQAYITYDSSLGTKTYIYGSYKEFKTKPPPGGGGGDKY